MVEPQSPQEQDMSGSNEVAGAGDQSGSGGYRAGVAVAAVAAFLIVWTTIVRDDGNAIGFFMVIMAVAVGWFAAGFRSAGMARTMLGVAVMQAAVGSLIATAPVTANVPGESVRALIYSGFFTVLWLISGAFFRAATTGAR
jgi:hypothetical protein